MSSRPPKARWIAASIALLALLAFYGHAWGASSNAQESAQATYEKSTEDERLGEQLAEVRERFPLVASAYDFLTRARYCHIDQQCFDAVQHRCLRKGLPPRFCFEEAQEKCCRLPVLVASSLATPTRRVPRLSIITDGRSEAIECMNCVCSGDSCECATCTITSE